MPKIELSDAGLRSLEAPERGTIDYWDRKLPAFACRVSQGGTKTFILKVQNSRRAIGRYPIISLAEARIEARRLLAEKTLGKTRPQAMTYPAALQAFLDEKAKSRRPRTVATLRSRLNQHFPLKGQLADQTHQEIGRRLSKIKTPSEHDHALSAVKTFFTWAHNRRLIDDNPVRGIAPRGHVARTRVLTVDEIRDVWEACDNRDGDLPEAFATIVKLLILTGQRRGEIARLRSNYYSHNQQTITLPSEIAKNHREHTFPVGKRAARLLTPLLGTDGYLFPARGKPSHPFSGWSKSKKLLDEISGVEGWTLHDLRRTFSTRLAELGTTPQIIERLLNHVSGTISGVSAIYNRHHFMPEMQQAVEKYEAHLLRSTAR